MTRYPREEGLVLIDDQRVVIHDLASLSSLPNFYESYLVPGRSELPLDGKPVAITCRSLKFSDLLPSLLFYCLCVPRPNQRGSRHSARALYR
jgi:hypothetical protein